MNDNILYIGVGGHVAAIDKTTGAEIWRTKLPNRGTITTIEVDRDMIFAHSRGVLFGLDATTGAIAWKNGLTGLGYGYCIMSGAGGGSATAISAAAATAASASANG